MGSKATLGLPLLRVADCRWLAVLGFGLAAIVLIGSEIGQVPLRSDAA